MNFIDIFIGAILLWAIYKGFTKGFIVEVASLIGFWAGLWGSIRFSDYLVPLLKKQFHWDSGSLPLIAFFICFLLIIVLIYFIAKLIQMAVEGMALGLVNKLGGALFNSFKYILLLSVLIFFLEHLPNDKQLISSKLKDESQFYNAFRKIAPAIIPSLKEYGEKLPELNHPYKQNS